MPVALLLALSVVAKLPDIAIKPTSKGFIAEVATFDLRQQAEVDAEIERRAADLCKEKQIRWGEFRSLAKLGRIPGAEPAPVTGYSKEFSCVVTPTASYPPAAADWQPTSADVNDALAFFQTYYAKRDSGDFAGAFGMFQPDAVSDRANWSEEMAAQNTKLGSGKRRVTSVTWYVNPDGAPHPGVYVAIDFIGEFSTAYFYCGYVALYRRGPGTYGIAREEQNMFTHGDGSADLAQIEQMRVSMCRGQ